MQNFCRKHFPFSKVHNINKSVNELNADLKQFSQCLYQRKTQFNRDPYKQPNEVICPRESDSENFIHPPSKFDNNSNGKCPNQEHLGFVLDSKLIFSPYVDLKIKKFNKLIGLIRRLSVNLPGIVLRYINH